MPNQNSRRNSRGLGQRVRPTVQDVVGQAQQQRQHGQLDQLDHLFRDLGVTASLDHNNSLPNSAPHQHQSAKGVGITERTQTSILRETPKSYAGVVRGAQTTCTDGAQPTHTNGAPAARPNVAAQNGIPTPPINGTDTPHTNKARGSHPTPTTSQANGTTLQTNGVPFPNLNVCLTAQGSIPRQTAQPRNNRRKASDTSNGPAPSQLPVIDCRRPVPMANLITRNPSRTAPAHRTPRLGLRVQSPILSRVQQLPIAPVRPTSPTLDRIHELCRAEIDINNNASTKPSSRSDRNQLETNSSTESFRTAPLNPPATSLAPNSCIQADNESIVHLPLENDVTEDGIVVIKKEVLIAGDEVDEFEVIENVTVIGSEHNGVHKTLWKIHRH